MPISQFALNGERSEWPTFDIWSDYCHKFIMLRIAASKHFQRSNFIFERALVLANPLRVNCSRNCEYVYEICVLVNISTQICNAVFTVQNFQTRNGFRIYFGYTFFFLAKVLLYLRSIYTLVEEWVCAYFFFGGCQSELRVMMLSCFQTWMA